MKPQRFGMGGSNLEDLGWNDMGFDPPKPHDAERDSDHDAFGEELGEAPKHPTGLTPVESPVHTQHAEIAERLGVDECEEQIDDSAELFESDDYTPAPVAVLPTATPPRRRSPRPRSAPGSKAKAAFTLRLDPSRHLKLRLACAVDGRSAQQLVTDALDRLLVEMPELDAMAEKAKRKG